ncbi:MAG TPA: PAS domain-containing protein [bacterium]|jgi:hypothetical protein
MRNATTARILSGNGQFAVSLIRPDGGVEFENQAAKDLLGRQSGMSLSILESLTVPGGWDEMMARLALEGTLDSVPVLLQTSHGDAELCYVTAIPQYSREGTLESVLCAWGTRRDAAATGNAENLADYTRDLESVLEHRTYQNLLAAEQNEFARDALDVLPTGILVASVDGEICYRNRSMGNEFGLHPADYLQLDISHVLSSDVAQAFEQVVENGSRRFLYGVDPGGLPAAVDLLPLLRLGRTQKVVVQFRRAKRGDVA